MSMTTDNVQPSPSPNSWQIGKITAAGVILASFFLAYCVLLLAFGRFELGLGTEELQTVSAVSIVFGSQATIYALRGHHSFFGQRPTGWLILSSITDILIISSLAIRGIATAPIPIALVVTEFIGAIVVCLILNGIKLPTFAKLGIP